MNLNQLVYKPGEHLIGYQENDYLYTINGIVYGQVIDKVVYSKDGHYIGEFNAFGYLVRRKRKLTTDVFELPENGDGLPKSLLFVGICKQLGVLMGKSGAGGPGGANEYPCTDELEQIYLKEPAK